MSPINQGLDNTGHFTEWPRARISLNLTAAVQGRAGRFMPLSKKRNKGWEGKGLPIAVRG